MQYYDPTNKVHVSTVEGNESVITWAEFCSAIYDATTDGTANNGEPGSWIEVSGVSIILSMDDTRPTFVIGTTSYTPLGDPIPGT